MAMFGMGTTIRIEDLKEIVRHPKAIAIGVIAQFLTEQTLPYRFP
ncbi:hypothetical protein [Cutibacterium sp.]